MSTGPARVAAPAAARVQPLPGRRHLTLAPDARLALHGGLPVRESFLVFGGPMIGEEEIAEVVDTLRSGWIGTGPKARELEERFREYASVPHAVAVSSCTAGLQLALETVGVRPGDEVITTPMTFAATANVVVHCGARPVFADIDRRTMNVDPAEIERRITPRTRAIVPVHMAGLACPMDEIRAVADAHGLPVVADAAHAIETRYHGRPVAQLADISAFSFYVTKNMTTAEGGMVTTGSADWAEELRQRSLHGLSRDAWKRYSSDGFEPYEVVYPGHKSNLSDLCASLGLHQLRRLDERWEIRDRHFRRYREALADVPGLLLPRAEDDPTGRHARHLFIVLLDLEALACDRLEFLRALQAENVGCGIHFTPVHLHPWYRDEFGFRPGTYPNAEWVGKRTISLPLSAKLTDDDVEDVIAAVRKVAAAFRSGR